MPTQRDVAQEPQASHYTYRVSWSSTDDEYIASVVEFPSLSWIAGSRKEALDGLTTLVEDVLQDMVAEGEEIPQPWDDRAFSGKFNLRLGPTLHKRVALAAAERHESINAYVIRRLAFPDPSP